jgi:hypothetical protein
VGSDQRPRLPFLANVLFFPANVAAGEAEGLSFGSPKHIFGLIKQITWKAAR